MRISPQWKRNSRKTLYGLALDSTMRLQKKRSGEEQSTGKFRTRRTLSTHASNMNSHSVTARECFMECGLIWTIFIFGISLMDTRPMPITDDPGPNSFQVLLQSV